MSAPTTAQSYIRIAPKGPQSVREKLQLDPTVELYRHVYPDRSKSMPRTRFRVSRARNHARENPSCQIKQMCREAYEAGVPMPRLLMLAADLEAYIRALYVVDVTPEAIRDASMDECAHDAAESCAQLALAHKLTPETAKAYRLAALKARGALDRLIVKVTKYMEAAKCSR